MYYVANARMPNEKAHGIQLAKQCEAFVAQGIDLVLVLPKLENEIKDSLEEFYVLHERISVCKVPILNLGNTGFAFNLRSFSFGISSFLYLLFKTGAKDTIVYTIDLDQFSFFLLPLLRAPVFFEVHGSKKKNSLLSFFLSRVRGIITNSRGVAAKLPDTFVIPNEKIITAPNGIDPKLFPSRLSKQEARAVLGLPHNREIIVHTGQFYDWKGLGIIAETAMIVPNMLIYLVGGTQEGFRAATNITDIPKNVICVGHKPLKEIPVWIAAADVLLVLGTETNSYSYTETSPMKIFEFLASGRPMVVSGTPANREIVTEREVYFYEPDNARSLAVLIEKSLHGEDSMWRAAHGKEKAKEYTWAARSKKIMTFISLHA